MRQIRSGLPLLTIAVVLAALSAGCGGGGGQSSSGGTGAGGGGSIGTVSATNPADNATNIPVNTGLLTATLEQAPPAGTTVSVTGPDGQVPGTTAIAGTTVCFSPSQELRPDTWYTASIVAGPAPSRPVPAAPAYSWTFKTGAAPALRGTLVPDDSLSGASLAGVTVQAIGISDNLATIVSQDNAVSGDAGRYSFATLSGTGGAYWLVAETTRESGAVRRILGMTRVFVEGTPARKDITVSDVTPQPASSRLVSFCGNCHGIYSQLPPQFQITASCAASAPDDMVGVPQETHPPQELLDAYGRTTCESCHSGHRPTGYGHFTLWDTTSGYWCQVCHYTSPSSPGR